MPRATAWILAEDGVFRRGVRFGTGTVVVPPPPPPPEEEPTGTMLALPSDAGIINLAAAPYNVKGDGVTDNTAAIQSALNDYSNEVRPTRFSFRTLLLPAGTVMISNKLHAPGAAIRIMGRGKDFTKLKLRDGATGFNNASAPKIVLQPGIEATLPGDNAAYANYVTDLTIDVGNNNPGAIGLRFAGCNSAAVERVHIQGGTGTNASGLRGLILETSPGPALVMDVSIDGFADGIWADPLSVNNMIFSAIKLTNQRATAIRNLGKVLQFEDLTVSGCPTVYIGVGHQAILQIIDGTLTGKGSGTAITSPQGYVYCRNVNATAWTNLITYGGTARFVGSTRINEWGSAPYLKGNTSVAWTESNAIASLNLAHPKAPKAAIRPLTQWHRANLTSGTADQTAALNAAIQAANTAGKKIVYVPYGDYQFNGTVVVDGGVERIDFMGSRLGRGTGGGKISIQKAANTFVVVENMSSQINFEQNGAGAVVWRHQGPREVAGSFVTTGPNATGDIYAENFGAQITYNITRPVKVYVRGSNREGQGMDFSGGCTVWMFGDNVEAHDDRGDPWATCTGSTLEILGGVWDNLATLGRFGSTTGAAMWACVNSTVSILYPGVYRGAAVTGRWVSDTKNGTLVGNVTDDRITDLGAAVGEWKRVVMPLYVSP